QPLVMIRELEADADLLVIGGAPVADLAAHDPGRAGVAAEEADQELLRRRLAGPRGPEEAEDLLIRDLEVEPAERRRRRLGVRERERFDVDHRPSSSSPWWRD